MAGINVDFTALHKAVARMGAREVDFGINLARAPMDPIDIAIGNGIEIALDEIEHENGLLGYKGRQILLYIKDHSYGRNFEYALQDGARGNRFHVADCRTLQEMRAKNRFQRYHVTRNLDGFFDISGIDRLTRQPVEGKAELRVCKYCLERLNYKGYASSAYAQRASIWKEFSTDEFFRTYSSFFSYLPVNDASANVQYTKDWPVVSGRLKADKQFTCEQCHVDMFAHRNLLHVHHINGVKSDNSRNNLKVLCADCHRKQVAHEHMFVRHKDMQVISSLRQEQGLVDTPDWDQVIRLADPGVEGLLIMCRKAGLSVPEIGINILDGNGKPVGQLELAWSAGNVGVAISTEDRIAAEENGWSAWSVSDAIDNFSIFSGQNRYSGHLASM